MEENAAEPKKEKTTTSIYMPVVMKNWLDEQAKREGRSVCGLVRWLLDHYRDELEGGDRRDLF